jgi:hypothetical protein
VQQVGRAGDLDVDPFAVAQRLGCISVIESVVGQNHGRVGKVGVQDRVGIMAVGQGGGCPVIGEAGRFERIRHPRHI